MNLGDVVGVDRKVEEDIGEAELEGWQQPCHDCAVEIDGRFSLFLHKLIDLFTKL